MTHEQAAAEMLIDAIRNQIKFIQAAGMSETNLKALVESIEGTIEIYDNTTAKLVEIDGRVG